MKNILVIAGSTHRESINLALAKYAAAQVEGAEIKSLDLNHFEMPLYSQDREEASGIPEEAKSFIKAIQEADALVVSLAEHNGSYTAAFKNVFDWTSRHEREVWANKPMLLMATSPGGRGGATVLAAAESTFPHLGGNIVATFSLPSFYDNFSEESGISDPTLASQLSEAVTRFSKS